MILRKGFFALLLFSIGSTSNAQQQHWIPTSPEAAALTKAINYPINYNTGIPNIGIPLYEIEAGGMKLPISINYHSGGFKIHERASNVGLGWALSSDIQITRTVNGLDDFLGPLETPGYISNSMMKVYNSNCSSCDYPLYFQTSPVYPDYEAYRIAAGEMDGMPDKFDYKLLNKSGSFYFRKDATGASYTIVPVPYDDIKISYNSGVFTLIDNDGTKYIFGVTGSLTETNVASMAKELSRFSNKSVVTSWKCVSIQNATKTDVINFTYQAKSLIEFKTRLESIEFYNNESPCGMTRYFTPDQVGSANPWIVNYEQLSSIYPFYSLSSPKYFEHLAYGKSILHTPYLNSQNNVIDKTYTLNDDLNFSRGVVYGIVVSKIDFKGGSLLFNGSDQLSSIKIQNSANEEIKTFAFFQTYTLPNNLTLAKYANGSSFNGTLYLDSIQIKVNNAIYDRYKLMYANKFCFGSHLQGKDAWGYANIYTSQRSYTDTFKSIPIQLITQRVVKDANGSCPGVDNVKFYIGSGKKVELVDATSSNAGMLKRIIYPTGGYTDFEFESNMYKQKGNSRLDLVVMSGGLRIKSVSNFDGKALLPVSQKYYRYGEFEEGTGLVINSPTQSYDSLSRYFPPYSYRQTVAYLTGPGTANFGTNFEPIPINCYDKTCLSLKYKETKTTYQPNSSVDYSYPHGAPIYYNKVTEYNSDQGEMSGKKVYNYYKHDQFWPYSFMATSKIFDTNIDVLQTDGLMGAQKSVEDYKYENGKYSLVHKKDYSYTKYSKNEEVRVVYAFFKVLYQLVGGNFQGMPRELYNGNKNFNYNNSYFFNDILSGQYSIQVAKLLLNTETEKWFEGTDSLQQVTNYEYGNSSYIQPSKITTTGSNGSISRSFKYAYDFIGTSVYDSMRVNNRINSVIEEITNRGTKEISRKKINYGFVNTPALVVPISVQKSMDGNSLSNELTYDKYDNNANLLQVTEKNTLVKSYIWGYNYKYPVAEVVGSNYSVATSGVNVATLNSLTNEAQIRTVLNGIRTALSTSMVSTYTYKPLIGVISETAPNGYAKTYEYDPFGRLYLVKDHNLNILKKNDYRTTGPISTNATAMYYVNTPVLLSYNKPCGLDSVLVNIMQPGGTYTSSYPSQASSFAEAHIESNWSSMLGNYQCIGDPVQALVTLQLNIATFLPSPTNVYVDFIKDKSIVASRKFPYGVNGVGYLQFRIAPGNYKIAIRLNENYNGSLSRVSLTPSIGNYRRLNSGDDLSIVTGGIYNFWLSNSL